MSAWFFALWVSTAAYLLGMIHGSWPSNLHTENDALKTQRDQYVEYWCDSQAELLETRQRAWIAERQIGDLLDELHGTSDPDADTDNEGVV